MFQVPSTSSMGSKIPPAGAYHLLRGERPCPGARPELHGTRLTRLQEPLQSSTGETATRLVGLPQNPNSHFLKTNGQNNGRSTSAPPLARPLLEHCHVSSSPWARQGGQRTFCTSCLACPGPAHRQTARLLWEGVAPHKASLPLWLHSPPQEQTAAALPLPCIKNLPVQQHEALQSQVKWPSCIREACRLCCF